MLAHAILGQGPRPQTPHVGTLGSTIRVGYSMMIHCGNWDCHHRATVDLEALQAGLGEDSPVANLVATRDDRPLGARGLYLRWRNDAASGLTDHSFALAPD